MRLRARRPGRREPTPARSRQPGTSDARSAWPSSSWTTCWDIWGDPATTGKPQYSDIARHKKTLPIISTLQSPPPLARAFAHLLAAGQELSHEDLERGASAIEQAGGRARTQAEADAATRRAMNLITRIAANEPAGDDLRQLAQLIVQRNH